MSHKEILRSILSETQKIEEALISVELKQDLPTKLSNCEKVLESILEEFVKNTDNETVKVREEFFDGLNKEELFKQFARIRFLSRQIKGELESHDNLSTK